MPEPTNGRPTIGEAIRRLDRIDQSLSRVHDRLDVVARDVASFSPLWDAMGRRVEALESNWTWLWRMFLAALALGAVGLLFTAVTTP